MTRLQLEQNGDQSARLAPVDVGAGSHHKGFKAQTFKGPSVRPLTYSPWAIYYKNKPSGI